MEDHPGGDEVLLSSTGNYVVKDIQTWIFPLFFEIVSINNSIGQHGFIDYCPYLFTGKDATDDFEDVGHSSSARAMMDDFYIGEVDTSTIPAKSKYTPPKQPQYNQDKTPEFVIKLLQFLVPLLILGLAFGVRFYTKSAWKQPTLKLENTTETCSLFELGLMCFWLM